MGNLHNNTKKGADYAVCMQFKNRHILVCSISSVQGVALFVLFSYEYVMC